MARMTRNATRGGRSLTASNNPQLERTARRIARQQKVLDRELMSEMGEPSQAKNRGIRIQNLVKLEPLTDTQADFFDTYEDGAANAFVLYGSAGTGKTYLACWHALREILSSDSDYQRIVIVRSTVQTRDMGFLPGDVEKLAPFEAPYHDIFQRLLGRPDAYDKLKEVGKVEFTSTAFLRGLSFDNAFIIVDEMQSMNWHELKTICTRLGKNSTIVFCGDGVQTDLIKVKNDVSGFHELLEVSKKMPSFRHFRFTEDDIVRSGFVKEFIKACNAAGL